MHLAFTLTLLLGLAAPLADAPATDRPATEAAPTEKPVVAKDHNFEVITLTLSPAKLPVPTLKHRLTPTFLEQTPGNAAPLYDKAFLILAQSEVKNETWDDISKWLEMPPAELPRDKVRETLARFRSVLHQAEMAARRERCDWELPIREETNVIAILLPEMSSARSVARLVALQARLSIAEKKYDEAITTLQTGYALARHVAEQPFLVSGLVGIAIGAMMNQQAAAIAGAADAPNLYWALTALPQPLVSLDKAFEQESMLAYLIFPELQPAKRAKYTQPEWEQALYQFFTRLREMGPILANEQQSPWGELQNIAMAAMATAMVPKCKADLKRRGHTEKELATMLPAQIVVLHIAETYDELRDDMFRWFHLPYWQAHERLAAMEEDFRKTGRQKEVIPLASLLLPAVSRCHFSQARLDRQVAALRTVEAIRLYMAEHDGKLPPRLDDIRTVPIPINPVTGKSFPYRVDGDTAILEADGPKNLHRTEYRLKSDKR